MKSTRNLDNMVIAYVSDDIVIYPNVIPHITVNFLHRLTIFDFLVSLYVELHSFITKRQLDAEFSSRPESIWSSYWIKQG
jgi:hypothetical protein